ncbi:aprataxin-like protein [Penicillium manginii]|uniref:aprataxin-like protein n=1 Tax=Penicillium manginii TaxID=203109 RepID=UPI002549A252|nr:aprataxin-like protein [Penicillium manginii]KAJ5755076.1 aprataxin-like protein [Penicillium manginii]
MSGMEQASASSNPPSEPRSRTAEKRNASKHAAPSLSRKPQSFGGRDGLGAYITNPEIYPSNVVISHNADFVAIHDMFPKSSLHLLLLPRDQTKTHLHPFEAFEDPEFLAKVKFEAQKLRSYAAAELRRKYGKYSVQEQERQSALNIDPPAR